MKNNTIDKSTAAVVEAAYNLPYQAHATPEPMNCTARVARDGCEIWAPTQNPKGAQEIAAQITGLNNKQINVHTTFLGGGFGRRVLVDYVGEAVEISQKVNAPVKVIWTREEDIQHDFPLLRMDEMPQVVVHIVPSSNPPSGLGEVGVPVIGPAVANAIYAATGKRIRKLPITPQDIVS